MEPVATKVPDTGGEPNPVTPNRRRRVRHKVHTPAYATLNGASGGMVLDLNEILDISQDGMAIQTSPPLEVNRTVSLCLDLSETKTYIHTTGNVIWSDRSGRTGIRFADMPEASVSHLKEWLFLNAMAGVPRGSAQPRRTEIQSKEAAPTSATVEVGALPADNDLKFAAPPDYTSTLTALAAVGREVEALGSELDAALQLVAERTLAFMHATGAAIALWLEDEMVCVAAAGPDAPGPGARFQMNSGFSGECIRTGKLLRCDDAEIDERVDREACRVLGIRSIIAIPIRMEHTVLGLLEVFSHEPNAFSENENKILQKLSDTALAAIKRAGQPPLAKRSPEVSGKHFRQSLSERTEIVAPKRFSLRRTLPIVAAATLALVLLWTITPWVRSWFGGSGQASSQEQASPYQSVPRSSVTSIADVSDLGALRKLAEEGNPAAQFALGARYATGQEVTQNYSEAVRWFSKAGEHGHVVAQATLGAYYWAGRGVPQDLSKAYFWSILAQAGGDEASKYRVAVLVSRMSRAQVVSAQEQADDWIKRHQLTSSAPPSSQ